MLKNVGPFTTKRLLLYGAGRTEDIDVVSVQRLAGAAISYLLRHRAIRSAAFLVTRKLETEAFAQAIVEGALMSTLNGELYRANDEALGNIETLDLISELADPPDFDRAINAGSIMGEAINYARELGF